MADNVTLPGTGSVVACDEIGSAQYQRVKLIHGADGTNDGDVAGANPLPVSTASSGTQRLPLFRYLDLNGDGTGTKSASSVHESPTDNIFYIQPPAGKIYRLARMIVYIEGAGSFDSGRYGNSGTPLAEGIVVRIQDDSGTILDMTNGLPVKTNSQWGRLCHDVEHRSFGSGNESLTVRWAFTKTGQYIRLDGDANERLEVFLDDDFSNLVDHTFMVQGYDETVST